MSPSCSAPWKSPQVLGDREAHDPVPGAGPAVCAPALSLRERSEDPCTEGPCPTPSPPPWGPWQVEEQAGRGLREEFLSLPDPDTGTVVRS